MATLFTLADGSNGRRRGSSAVGVGCLALVVALVLPAWAAGQQPPPAPAPPAPEVVEPVVPPAAEEALQELEDALDDVQERLEDEARDRNDERVRAELEDQRERMRDIREQVRRRVREATSRSDSKVSFGSSIHVEEGEVGRDLVAIGGSVRIDGDVSGDAVAVGGGVYVNGRVTGNVVAVGAGVELGPEAEVLGEVTSVGGKVEKAEGARIYGRTNEISVGPGLFNVDWNDDWDHDWGGWYGPHWRPFGFMRWMSLGWDLSWIVMLAILACFIQLIGSGTVERVRAKAVEAPWLAGLVGLAIQVLFLPVLIVVILLLVISIIGIPLLLLVPFALVGLLVAWLVGYTGSAMAVGRWAERRFGWSLANPFIALLLGIGLIQILAFLGDVLDLLPGFVRIFAVMFGIVGFLIKYAAWTIGLGAVFLGGFQRGSRGAAAPVPPPPPATPEPPSPQPPAEPEVLPPTGGPSELDEPGP